MSTAKVLSQPTLRFMMQVQSGPDKGQVYQLFPPKVTVGRGNENHIVLTDPKCSRQHCTIEFTPQNVIIRDVSQRQTLLINQQPTPVSELRNNDFVKIGDTVILFRVERPLLPPDFQRPPPMPQAGASSFTVKRALFWGVPLLLILWLVAGGGGKKKKPDPLTNSQEVEKTILQDEEQAEVISRKKRFANDEEKTRYEEANRHFLEGFRDYQKGQFLRAAKSFETARAIDPHHELAERYQRLAERQRDETVVEYMLEARRYKEKGMYSRCAAALDKAMSVMTNKTDVKFKEAEALKKLCSAAVEDRY